MVLITNQSTINCVKSIWQVGLEEGITETTGKQVCPSVEEINFPQMLLNREFTYSVSVEILIQRFSETLD